MTVRELQDRVGDATLSGVERRTRLQGWRGDDARRADDAALAQRLAPAACAVGAFAGVALRSPIVLSVFAATALVGAVAANHPVEALYNAWAARRGRPTLPANRAAKRLGCAIGLILLGGSAIAYATGRPTLGLGLGVFLGSVAAFVAVTGWCVPSMLFTVLWGADRACERDLLGAR